jgi:hypothetical protein
MDRKAAQRRHRLNLDHQIVDLKQWRGVHRPPPVT